MITFDKLNNQIGMAGDDLVFVNNTAPVVPDHNDPGSTVPHQSDGSTGDPN